MRQQKLMDSRITKFNDKISKSGEQLEKLMSSLNKNNRPSHVHYRQKSNQLNTNMENPQQQSDWTNKKYDFTTTRNSKTGTNTSLNFSQTKNRFHSGSKLQQVQRYNKSLNMREKLQNEDREQSILQQLEEQKRNTNYHNIFDLNHQQIMNYVLNKLPLSYQSKQEQIYDFFQEFTEHFQKPLIKKYSNCIYMCESVAEERKEGKFLAFIYFLRNRFYYGYIENQQKSGLGVEINLENQRIYKGTFIKGYKVGKFTVFCDDKIYQGYLNKGKFHGYGRLQTPISTYTGQFANGRRHGQGQQHFVKSGLALKGNFIMDSFSNQFQNQSHMKESQVIKQQKPKIILPNFIKPTQTNQQIPTNTYSYKQFDFQIFDNEGAEEQQPNGISSFNKAQKYIYSRDDIKKYNKITQSRLSSILEEDATLPSHFRRKLPKLPKYN